MRARNQPDFFQSRAKSYLFSKINQVAIVCAIQAWPFQFLQFYPGRAFLIAFLTCLALGLIHSYCRLELDPARTWPIWRMRAAVFAGFPALLVLVSAIGHTYQ